MARRALKVLVAGGGIGGLATAVTLRGIGAEPHVLERATELRAAGSGLSILSNATSALREIGVDLRLEEYGQELLQFDINTWRGRRIQRMPTADIAAETGSPSVLIHRADLLRALLDAAGDVPLRLGAQITEYTTDADGVRVTLADGRTVEGDLLVGADGLFSAVRRQLVGPEPLREPGYINWLATVPFRHPTVPTGYCGHFWHRGQRFGLIDIGRGRVYWWATQNRPPESARSWSGSKTEIQDAFRRFPEQVRAVIETTPESDIISVPARDRAFIDRWGLVHHTLHADDLHALLTESRRQRTTVHGALSATLVRATVEHRAELFSAEDQPGGAGATRITLGSPVDLRSRLREPVEPYEVGAFVSMLRTNVDHDPDRDLWDEARAITDELRTRQEHGEDFCMLHISRWVVPNTAKRSERTLEAVEKGNPQNLALSNFGRVDFPDSAGSLRLSGVHLAASLGASCYLGATVITAYDTLSLNLNYLREAISDETARSIATRWYTLIRLRAALVKNP